MEGGQPIPPATVSQFVDVVGLRRKEDRDRSRWNCFGLQSHHGGGVTGWQSEGEGPNVTAELLRHGYSERDIAKLWGGNFLRVRGEAQKAGKLRKSFITRKFPRVANWEI